MEQPAEIKSEHKKLVQELLKAQADSLELKDEIWEEKPVSSKEFFEKFIHEACYPEQQKFVDVVLGEKADEWNSDFAEGIALCGKGSGKDRTICKLITYCIYKLLCMRNPQRFLGLNDNDLSSPESAIDVGNVSLNSRLASDVFFKNFVTMVRHTYNPKTGKNWFEEHGLNLDRDIQKKEIKFKKGITAYSLDSEEYTGEGLNLLLVVFDEVGGFDPGNAEKLYTALASTQKTRFGGKRKTLLISYKRDDNDFMMIRYNQAEREPKTYRTKASTWVWNPKRKKEDFAEDYLKSPEDAKRIYECEGSTTQEGYFKYKVRIKESVNPNRVNPIESGAFTINGESDPSALVWTDSILSLRFKEFFVPIKNIDYFVHVDLAKGKSSGDYAGFTLGHYTRNQEIKLSEDYIKELIKAEGFNMSRIVRQKETAVIIDLLLQLRAKAGKEIDFDEIREFIQSLKCAGFNIRSVTFDSWQSTYFIQTLNKSGILSEVQSVDRNTEAYDTLKEIMYKGLLDIYYHPIFIRECEELIRKNNGKVDHPDLSYRRSISESRLEGSKDTADSAAAVVNSCIKYSKGTFGVTVAGDGETTGNQTGLKRPDEAEKEKLCKYGQRPPM